MASSEFSLQYLIIIDGDPTLDNQCPGYNTIPKAEGQGALKEKKGAKHWNGRAEFSITPGLQCLDIKNLIRKPFRE